MAAEVEKYFETRVNPETIKSKALRMQAGSNGPPAQNPATAGAEGGNTGNNITTQEAVAAVENEIEKGTPVREAARKIAESTGMNDGS